jgi:DNA-binding transcriptional MerR regulator
MRKNSFDNEYLTINEFAQFVEISASALRHYDKTGVFKPAKRGKGFDNNYRFYSPRQIITVKMLRVLTNTGVPLTTIKTLSQERTPETILKLLIQYKPKIEDEILFFQGVSSIIDTFTDLLHEAIDVTETDLSIVRMPVKKIILGSVNNFQDTIDFTREFLHFCDEPHTPMLNLSFPIGGYFETMAEFLEQPSQTTRFFSIDPRGCEEKQEGLYLVGYTRGYYGQTHSLPNRMAEYAKENGVEFDGPVYNIYLSDEISTADTSKYLLQVSASIKETSISAHHKPHHRKIKHT